MKKFLVPAALLACFTACSDDSSSSSSGTIKATCDYDPVAGYYLCGKDENGNYTYAIDEDDIIYLTTSSESSSSACIEEEESSSSVCAELSVECLRGTWTFSHFFDAESSTYAEPNQLSFNSCQEFTYTPSSNDTDHTYCVGYTLSGTYEISDAHEIIFHAGKDGSTTLAGLCFLDSVGTASITDDGTTRTLLLTGAKGYSLFVPNAEGAVTEVYVKD